MCIKTLKYILIYPHLLFLHNWLTRDQLNYLLDGAKVFEGVLVGFWGFGEGWRWECRQSAKD